MVEFRRVHRYNPQLVTAAIKSQYSPDPTGAAEIIRPEE
jgi:hypothetical protein